MGKAYAGCHTKQKIAYEELLKEVKKTVMSRTEEARAWHTMSCMAPKLRVATVSISGSGVGLTDVKQCMDESKRNPESVSTYPEFPRAAKLKCDKKPARKKK